MKHNELKTPFGDQRNRIISLITYLVDDLGVSQKDISKMISKQTNEVLSPSDDYLSRIKNGLVSFSRSASKLPMWIETLEKIKGDEQSKNNAVNKSMPNPLLLSDIEKIKGFYIGFYKNPELEKTKQGSIRLLLLNLGDKGSASMESESYLYSGNYQKNGKALTVDLNIKNGTEPLTMWANLDKTLISKKEIESVVFCYLYAKGCGMESGILLFFRSENNPVKNILDKCPKKIFINREGIPIKFQNIATAFFAEKTGISIPKCIFEVDELD
jgi:hypothetical protein